MVNQGAFQAANAYILSQLKLSGESAHKKLDKINPPFITISREAGAGGTAVGEKLVDYLNAMDIDKHCEWTLFDKNLIAKVIEEHNLPEEFSNYLPEKKISELQSIFEQISGLHPAISKLIGKTCNTILHLASMGNVVLIGRGANILTRNLSGGFHVRLIAETDWRIKQIERLFSLNRKDAFRFMEKEDLARKEYVKKHFNKDVGDHLLYDLIINTSSISFQTAAEIIGNHVMQRKKLLLQA